MTDAPLAPYETRVVPEWVDYNGHLSEAYYVLVFGHATDRLLDAVGLDAAGRERLGSSLYTLEAHVCYLAEVHDEESLHVTTRVLGVDAKRVHLFHAMRRGTGGDLVATTELLMCHVDTAAGRSAPLPDHVADALQRLREADRDLPPDPRVGRSIDAPR